MFGLCLRKIIRHLRMAAKPIGKAILSNYDEAAIPRDGGRLQRFFNKIQIQVNRSETERNFTPSTNGASKQTPRVDKSSFNTKTVFHRENSFLWSPKSSVLNGECVVAVEQEHCGFVQLDFHIGNYAAIMPLNDAKGDAAIAHYKHLMKYCFCSVDDLYAKNTIIQTDLLKVDAIRHRDNTANICFVEDPVFKYSSEDILRKYFIFLRDTVSKHTKCPVEVVLMDEADYLTYHNSRLHVALDQAGLKCYNLQELRDNGLYHFFREIKIMMNVACTRGSDLPKPLLSNKKFIESYGYEEPEYGDVFEVEFDAEGSTTVHVLFEEKRVEMRNHIGDFETLRSVAQSHLYDDDLARNFMNLVELCIKSLIKSDKELKTYIKSLLSNKNSKSIYSNNSYKTKFGRTLEFQFPDGVTYNREDVIGKYIQFIAEAVRKTTGKSSRKIIITSRHNGYELFENSVLERSMAKSGYVIVGQNIYDERAKHDTLDEIFNSIKFIINYFDRNDSYRFYKAKSNRSKENAISKLFGKLGSGGNFNMHDMFAVEMYNIEYASVAFYYENDFMYLKNHIGDLRTLDILEKIPHYSVVPNEKKIIKNFKDLLIFAMRFLSKSCNDSHAQKYSTKFIKIISNEPLRFQLDGKTYFDYNVEDVFIKYFTYLSRSVSRITLKKVDKLILAVGHEMNIFQRTEIRNSIFQTPLKLVRILSLSSVKILSLCMHGNFNVYFQKRSMGNNILIDYDQNALSVSVFTAYPGKPIDVLISISDLDHHLRHLEKDFLALLVKANYTFNNSKYKDDTLLKKFSNEMDYDYYYNTYADVGMVKATGSEARITKPIIQAYITPYVDMACTMIDTALQELDLNIFTDIVCIWYHSEVFPQLFGYLLRRRLFSPDHEVIVTSIDYMDTTGALLEAGHVIHSGAKLLQTRLSYHLGFEIVGGVFDSQLKRGTVVPCHSIRRFITSFDHQGNVILPFYQGERPFIAYCMLLGGFHFTDLYRNNAGNVELISHLDIDINECFDFRAKNVANGLEAPQEVYYAVYEYGTREHTLVSSVQHRGEDTYSYNKIMEFKTLIYLIRNRYPKNFQYLEKMNYFLHKLNEVKYAIIDEEMDGLYEELNAFVRLANIDVSPGTRAELEAIANHY